jgi:hypothetical protein
LNKLLNKLKHQLIKKGERWDSSGGPVAKTLSFTGQGTRSHMPQLKILHATMKTEDPKYCNLRPSTAKQINNHKLTRASIVIIG